MTPRTAAALALLLAASPPPAMPPKLVLAKPFALDPGKTTKLTLRGLRLDGATALRVGEPKSSGRVLGKLAKVGGAPRNELVPLYGDQQVEAEVTLPADVPGRAVPLTIVTPGGESPPLLVLVNGPEPRTAEKEPNDGFREAQAVAVPAVIDGRVERNQDVDVYRVEAAAGDRLVFEVQAARYGSRLDAALTVYDAGGRTLASADDGDDSADPRLEFTAPHAGAYFVAVTDAFDYGGETHPYRLRVQKR